MKNKYSMKVSGKTKSVPSGTHKGGSSLPGHGSHASNHAHAKAVRSGASKPASKVDMADPKGSPKA